MKIHPNKIDGYPSGAEIGLLDFTSSDSEGKNFMKMLLALLTG